MKRNFFRHIETCFSVPDRKLKRRVINEGLQPYPRDNRQAWLMDGDGNYRLRITRRAMLRSAQRPLLDRLAVDNPSPDALLRLRTARLDLFDASHLRPQLRCVKCAE